MGVLAPILEDQGDGGPQALQRLVGGAALAVGAWDVAGVGKVPAVISLHENAEFIIDLTI